MLYVSWPLGPVGRTTEEHENLESCPLEAYDLGAGAHQNPLIIRIISIPLSKWAFGAKFIIIMQTQLHQVGEKSSIESHEYPNHE